MVIIPKRVSVPRFYEYHELIRTGQQSTRSRVHNRSDYRRSSLSWECTSTITVRFEKNVFCKMICSASKIGPLIVHGYRLDTVIMSQSLLNTTLQVSKSRRQFVVNFWYLKRSRNSLVHFRKLILLHTIPYPILIRMFHRWARLNFFFRITPVIIPDYQSTYCRCQCCLKQRNFGRLLTSYFPLNIWRLSSSSTTYRMKTR